ncbi:adenosine nucleotide hydrolase [Flavobacterium columnare]|uniref:Dph6-related ATP pyrophosphatase n=1 Tax=Flavobacterium columnare TaxID=996 RepID=UPI0007F9B3A8|nr:diphthine--ammonia ligase [Flavobacterium columnare]ANO47935.1 hypothetical protein Pf1_02481 [Flavobacterium columnare]APT21481.1 adenosine nucleotide hydrolase [Flavobacterium columnare]MBF6652315.1 adenosine nucleotide hydrolase [Flavobacterium columnare]
MKAILSWSGGKDSCYATIKAIKSGYQPTVLLNMMNENGKVSRSHGLTQLILEQQANQLKIPFIGIPTTWSDYEKKYIETLHQLKKNYEVEHVIFGDIDLAPHKEWEEKVCQEAKLNAILPLWQQDRLELVKQMIEQNIVCMIVSCNTTMGVEFLGEILTKEIIQKLIQLNIDPCGENGEFHTVVINCPLFDNPIVLPNYKKEIYQDYCFLVWEK